MSHDAVALAFLERLVEDRRSGVVRSLEDYLRLFPGFEEVVAETYETAIARRRQTEAASVEAPASAALHDGAFTIGHYRLVHELGRGGQGVVYKAVDERVDRLVALKVLTGVGLLSEEVRLRFRREAAIAAKLSHSNICTVYEADIQNGVPYIAMQLVEGVTLADVLRDAQAGVADDMPNAPARGSSGPSGQELTTFVSLVEKVARALHHAHECGIVHRDVKPGNILVPSEGEPLLTDFGLATSTTIDQATLTLTGDLLGTPAYMSPEQLTLGSGHSDRRSDVYSLGATLYECLTLTRPFRAPTREALYQQIQTRDATSPGQLNPYIPAELSIVVETALEKNRDHRYQTAEELADDLRRVRLREPIRARPIGPWIRVLRWGQRNPAVAAALLLTILLLSVLVGVYAWKNRELAAAMEQLRSESTRVAQERERVTRLKDRRTLRRLLERAESLYPARPERIGAFETWLADAERLIRALPVHRAALAAIVQTGGPRDEEEAWIQELLSDLVAQLEALEEPQGVVADIRARLQRAQTIAPATVADHAADWKAARSRVEAGDRYRELALEPVIGLIPLGPDPESGLEEFLHWATHAPGHPLPRRGPDGKLAAMDGETGIILVLLPGGSFVMGSAREGDLNQDKLANWNEYPPHEVTLDPFFISKYELTRGQWTRLSGAKDPSHHTEHTTRIPPSDYGRYPVELVSWVKAVQELGRGDLELPTEARWEYACRAGTTTRFSFPRDRDFPAYANLAEQAFAKSSGAAIYMKGYDDGHGHVAPVGSYKPNPFGLHDVHGNLTEWCQDLYGRYKGGHAPGDGALLQAEYPDQRIFRGGCFDNGHTRARSAARDRLVQHVGRSVLGVRPARDLTP